MRGECPNRCRHLPEGMQAMTAALICFGVLCLSALVVVTLDDSDPLDYWGDDDA